MIGRLVGRLAVIALLASSGCVIRPSVVVTPLDRTAATEPAALIEYADFWDAMAHWDLSYVRSHPVTEEQRMYSEALANIDRGDPNRGIEIARGLIEKGSDPSACKNARRLINTVLVAQWRWDRLILADSNEVLSEVDARARGLAEQMRRMPQQEHEFREPLVQIQAENRMGLLLLPVQINGRTRSLVLDTGADVTVLSSDVADLCGVELVPNYTYKVRTANGHLASQLGRIDRLDVGGLTIRSHPVMVVPQRDMLTPRFPIDGVLGITAIRAMDIAIDYGSLTMTIGKPEPRKDVVANLLPTNSLILKAKTSTGLPILMMFDTGCARTHIFKGSLPYLGLVTRGRLFHSFTSFGSQKNMLSGIIREMDLVLDSWQVHWTNIVAGPDLYEEPMPVHPMGILGSDLLRDGGHVRIDWTNRRVDFWWDAIDRSAEDL